MAKNILYKKISSPVEGGGVVEYHSVDVINENGVPTKSLNTTDSVAAAHFINEAKKNNPGATVNGDAIADPLSEDTDSVGAGIPNMATPGTEPPPPILDPASQAESPFNPPPLNPDGPDSGRNSSSTNKITKKTRNISGVSKSRLQDYKNITEQERGELGVSGVFGNVRLQPMAIRQDVPCERVLRGKDNNAFIVLGNDRVNFPHSGYGGKGHTQTDCIDIVAGLGGHSPVEFINESVEAAGTDLTAGADSTVTGFVQVQLATNPNFFIDAARIIVSQKTDIDKNFGIAEFKGKSNDEKLTGPYSAKSAVAAKADNIRLIGRESLRLVTGTDKFNSQGGKIDSEKAGIELISNNDHTTLQPLVLGDNLAEGMRRLMFHLEKIAYTMHLYIKYQTKFNQAIQNHKHHSPFYGKNTTKSLETMQAGLQLDLEIASQIETDLMKHSSNLAGVKSKYFYDSGSKYIGSPNNKTN